MISKLSGKNVVKAVIIHEGKIYNPNIGRDNSKIWLPKAKHTTRRDFKETISESTT